MISGRKVRIHQRLAEELGVAIVGGEHPAGALLPNEVEASERLGVSRTAYREALRILAAKGLVDSRPRTGTRVRSRGHWQTLDPDVLSWMFRSEPSRGFVNDLFELRAIVEPAAAALAAERRTADQVSHIRHALEDMARHGLGSPGGIAADEAFHAAILRASGNEAIVQLVDSITAAIRWTVILKRDAGRLDRDSLPEHRALYEAIADADPKRASAAARRLIQLGLENTQRALSRASARG